MPDDFITRIDSLGSRLPLDGDVAARRRMIGEGEVIHRRFQARLGDDYVDHVEAMLEGGAHLVQLVEGGQVRALAIWRTYLTTYCGARFEIDDLVTDEAHRSKGYGATLLTWLEAKARSRGADAIMLSSATHRGDAHRFYFRERFAVTAFHFSKFLTG